MSHLCLSPPLGLVLLLLVRLPPAPCSTCFVARLLLIRSLDRSVIRLTHAFHYSNPPPFPFDEPILVYLRPAPPLSEAYPLFPFTYKHPPSPTTRAPGCPSERASSAATASAPSSGCPTSPRISQGRRLTSASLFGCANRPHARRCVSRHRR